MAHAHFSLSCRILPLATSLTRYRAGALWLAVAASQLQPQPIPHELQQGRGLNGFPSVLLRAFGRLGGWLVNLVQQGGGGNRVALGPPTTSNQRQAHSDRRRGLAVGGGGG